MLNLIFSPLTKLLIMNFNMFYALELELYNHIYCINHKEQQNLKLCLLPFPSIDITTNTGMPKLISLYVESISSISGYLSNFCFISGVWKKIPIKVSSLSNIISMATPGKGNSSKYKL